MSNKNALRQSLNVYFNGVSKKLRRTKIHNEISYGLTAVAPATLWRIAERNKFG